MDGELFSHRILQQDGQLVAPLDDRKNVLQGDPVGLDIGQLIRVEIKWIVLGILVDDLFPLAQADIQLEIAVILVFGLEIGQRNLLRNHGKMAERDPQDRLLDDGHCGRTLDIVGQILRADNALVVQEMGRIGRADILLGRLENIGQDHVALRRGLKIVRILAGDHGDGHIGQGRRQLFNLLVLGPVVGDIDSQGVHQQAQRPVGGRVVELEFARAAALEKD